MKNYIIKFYNDIEKEEYTCTIWATNIYTAECKAIEKAIALGLEFQRVETVEA